MLDAQVYVASINWAWYLFCYFIMLY